jgi:hypothetical protein
MTHWLHQTVWQMVEQSRRRDAVGSTRPACRFRRLAENVVPPSCSAPLGESLSENVAAGILACRGGRHLAARKNRPPVETLAFHHEFPVGDAVPPGWKPRLYVSQDG